MNWDSMREQMPITERWAYFDHAAVAPLPRPTAGAINEWLSEAVDSGLTAWSRWSKTVEALRTRASRLIGASPPEIALVPNTTAGISLVADGFPWCSGDNIVTLSNEFPTNIYPWLNQASRGVEVRRVPVDHEVHLEDVLAHIDGRTRIVSLSWVSYCTGWRLDIAELAGQVHQRGALLFVDAIQGLGVFPLNVRDFDIDFLAADGHKWMLGPEGAGLAFVRHELLDLLRPLGVGWNSVVQQHDFSTIELKLRDSAARYEGGTQNMCGLIGFDASLQFLQEYGLSDTTSPVGERVLSLTTMIHEKLRQIGADFFEAEQTDNRSGIVAFRLPGCDSVRVRQHCLQQNVVLGCRSGRLRASPHAYNNEEDIDKMVTSLGQVST